MECFGSRLKYLRTQKDMSLEELAEAVNSTKSTLSKYERGIVQPNLDSAKEIAKYFGVTVDWLSGYGDLNKINASLADSKDLEELKNVPKLYITVLKDAISSGFTPEELKEILAMAKKLRGIGG